MQAGQRQYPSKFPAQHLTKPGREAALKVRPMFAAPAYLGSEKLKDYAAIITSGDSASPSCSSYITGEILPIIGGYSGG